MHENEVIWKGGRRKNPHVIFEHPGSTMQPWMRPHVPSFVPLVTGVSKHSSLLHFFLNPTELGFCLLEPESWLIPNPNPFLNTLSLYSTYFLWAVLSTSRKFCYHLYVDDLPIFISGPNFTTGFILSTAYWMFLLRNLANITTKTHYIASALQTFSPISHKTTKNNSTNWAITVRGPLVGNMQSFVVFPANMQGR